MTIKDKIRKDIITYFGGYTDYAPDLPLVVNLTKLFNVGAALTLRVYKEVMEELVKEGVIEANPKLDNSYRLTTLV